MDIVTCSECQKSFASICNLRKHAKKFHPDRINIIVPSKQYKYQCKQCKRNFNILGNFNYHEKKCGSSITSLPSREKAVARQQCTVCQFQAPKDKLLMHFKTDHNIEIMSEHMDLGTFVEFLKWKQDMEATSHSHFIKTRGNYSTKSNDKTIIKYTCHRSGHFFSRGKGLHHLKTQGSNKINGFCPASLKIEIDKNDHCKVVFRSKHVGHDNDLGHLSLTVSERESLARQMALKIPFPEILDQVRDSVQGSNQLERIHLLTRHDLYNIEKSFNLRSTVVRHQDDAISVEAWIMEMESSGCILFYKGQGNESVNHAQLNKEDFVLIIMNPGQEEVLKKYCSDCICLDGTHGLNQYDFKLHTLLVLDDVREGFPCAFLISNRSDEQVLKIFYHYVKNKIGYQIACKVFMSDMAEAYYNAWQQIMGPAEFRLFCTWHVDRSWRKNLSKIKDRDKQVLVYKHLRIMLQETDARVFSCMMKYFLSSMLCDPDAADFAEYFKNNYTNNTQSWAYCYRLHSGLNTNMHIERMHETIKYIYFNGKTVKRLDKAINEIQKFVRDRLFNRLIVLNKGKLSKKLQELRARHKASTKLSSNKVVKNGAGWDVASSSPNCFDVYNIQENENSISCTCKLICTECNVCIHRYSCTCIDACIRWNMCKHVHLLCRHLDQIAHTRMEPVSSNLIGLGNVSNLAINENPANNEMDGILTSLRKYRTKDTNLSNKDEEKFLIEKEKILTNLIPDLIRKAENMTCMEQVRAFKKLCTPIGPTLDSIENKQKEIGKLFLSNTVVPHNKKIIPQRFKLRSTRNKKRKNMASKNLYSQPTTQEKQEIALPYISLSEQTNNLYPLV